MTGGTFALEKEYPVTAIYPEDMIPWTSGADRNFQKL